MDSKILKADLSAIELLSSIECCSWIFACEQCLQVVSVLAVQHDRIILVLLIGQ